MKYDRIQEMFRYITPGFFLLALVFVINFNEISDNEKLKDAIARFSAIIIVLLPFVGFVTGYLIECLMAWVERTLYLILPRPSRVVLNGKCSLYFLADDLRRAITNGDTVDNKEANRFQQTSKQKVGDKDVVSRCYYQSIMARHIWGAVLIACIYYLAFAGGWTWGHFVWGAVILIVLTFFWYHQTCVYMKYLFAEYGKTLQK